MPLRPRRAADAVPTDLDRRLARARAELRAAIRARREHLARFPSPPPRRPSLPDRFARGFAWGLLLGLVLEAAALALLPYLAAGVRAVGT